MDTALRLHFCMMFLCYAAAYNDDSKLPLITEFTFPQRTSVGYKAGATCFADHSPVEFSWLKDGEKLRESANIGITSHKDFSVIIVNPVSLLSSGNYTCVARNEFGTSSYSAALTVLAPPRWLIEPTPVAIGIGSGVSIDCAAEGSPVPFIKWYKAENNHIVKDNIRLKVENGTLILNSVTMEDSGEYKCTADNSVSPSISKTIWIKVNEFFAMTWKNGIFSNEVYGIRTAYLPPLVNECFETEQRGVKMFLKSKNSLSMEAY